MLISFGFLALPSRLGKTRLGKRPAFEWCCLAWHRWLPSHIDFIDLISAITFRILVRTSKHMALSHRDG